MIFNRRNCFIYFQIANEMDVLLISDEDTDKASAACDVFIGQLCDYETHQGIAHFCEHMLFIGTTKYPTENENQRQFPSLCCHQL